MTPTLKIVLIRLFLLPRGFASIVCLSLLGLMMTYVLLPAATPTPYQERETFPHRWRGVSPTGLMSRMVWLNRAIVE